MEFNEKLQKLRLQKGLTQEELAKSLYVSRTAVSKWESGRGFPSIESLKQISKIFSLTIDELLSGEELLNIAYEENHQKRNQFRDLIFGFLDLGMALLLFLPFFAQKSENIIEAVSLLALNSISPYLKSSYFILVFLIMACGILTLALQNFKGLIWVKSKNKVSLMLNLFCCFLFIISSQPYAAIYLFLFIIIKVCVLFKKG